MLPTVKPAARAAPGPWRALAPSPLAAPGYLERCEETVNGMTERGGSATPLAGASL
jgi:hypothetical protein